MFVLARTSIIVLVYCVPFGCITSELKSWSLWRMWIIWCLLSIPRILKCHAISCLNLEWQQLKNRNPITRSRSKVINRIRSHVTLWRHFRQPLSVMCNLGCGFYFWRGGGGGGRNPNQDSRIRKRMLRFMTKLKKRIMNPENPHFEWVLHIKSKSSFLRFMIRTFFFLAKDPKKKKKKHVTMIMPLAQCMLVSLCHVN